MHMHIGDSIFLVSGSASMTIVDKCMLCVTLLISLSSRSAKMPSRWRLSFGSGVENQMSSK
eukprot:6359005-Pyramimonas_sp.AAC.1